MNRIAVLALAGVLLATASATGSDGPLFEQDTTSKVTFSRRPSLVPLTRVTFNGNVLEEEGYTEHWMVLFCVDWYPPCQALQTPFMGLAEKHSKAFNNDTLLNDFVRFGTVDCAVDKVLCNEQSVETYPSVFHYTAGEQLTGWTGGSEARDAKSYSKWVLKELTSFKAISLQPAPPLLTRTEWRTVMRLLACIAASISSFVWAVGRGADLWLALGERRRLKRASIVARDDPQKSSSETPTDSSGESPGDRLTRRLPRQWASERGGLEL
eukprot:CAMPEP_0204516658 /NCGR_PEP_ID=MMETSP0661-20131031/3256_1 /ASSEMBLY_ACC=CAM_ASM_000606 /TAXON_ID=109239 /ORGANISM="Alexandrium margalefi, Strain AMGDE01CS-322" /LENGTH=267 /DNA_ID=CAMNT_0051522023 /DNA_START=115 /DNA_END=918 /DNA_ORIENTATION=-